ncbi:MAG: tetratricopeptide repeat protein [Gemmataceae bacterium]
MFSSPAKLLPSLRGIPSRFLSRLGCLLLLGAIVAAAGVNLWAWHHFSQAGRSLERYHFSEAYAHYTQALKVWRWSASLHFQAARTARRAGLYPQAEHHLAEYQRLQGDSAEAALALERLLLQAQTGDIDGVEDVLWQYLGKKKPDSPLVLEALARGYVRVLRLSAAMNCLRRIRESDPDNIEALVLTGQTIEKGNGDTVDALKFYRAALELDPDRDDARLSLAEINLRDSAKRALENFEFLRKRHPDNVRVMLGLAQAHRQLGELEQARPILEAILAEEPDNTKALTELGQLAKEKGAMARAESLFRQALAADPANRDAHFRLYECLAQQHKENEAAQQYARYERVEKDLARMSTIVSTEMTRSPKDPKLRYELGSFYLRYGKPEIGVRWLQSALKLDPNHQPSHQALADYYQRAGDVEQAEWHRSRLSRVPTEPAAKHSIAAERAEKKE